VRGLIADLWYGSVTLNTGDTYPNSTARTFVQLGDLVFPWDGSVVVTA
jgi:hypothetical protein